MSVCYYSINFELASSVYVFGHNNSTLINISFFQIAIEVMEKDEGMYRLITLSINVFVNLFIL